jgi:hypothetical protein
MMNIFAIALLCVITSSSIAFAGGQCPLADAAAAQSQAPEDEAEDMDTEIPAETELL